VARLWGLLVILATVSILSVVVLTRYSRALDVVFRENYDSAVYCDAMKASLDQLNRVASELRECRAEPADRRSMRVNLLLVPALLIKRIRLFDNIRRIATIPQRVTS
jgi:hypothetical protein